MSSNPSVTFSFLTCTKARIPVEQPGRIDLVSSRQHLPYESHPIFTLRKSLIMAAITGCLLSFLSYNPYGGEVFAICVLFLAVSILFAACGLTSWAMEKKQKPDQEPAWPRTVMMLGDVALAVVLQLLFWVSASFAEHLYSGSRVIAAYAALSAFACS